MSLLFLILASVSYAAGGVFMKLSDGATRIWPTSVFLTLFLTGALLQARGMRQTELSVSYIVVLGIEALAAILLGTIYLHESLTWPRGAAILLIVVGVAWLRST